jgi:hypothetical protein
MGPLICAMMYEQTGNMRHAMWYLVIVILTGAYLTRSVDEVKGSDDCRRKEIMVRMAGDRKKFGVEKSAAPPSARKQAGLKSSGKTGLLSSGTSGRSGASTRSSGASSSSGVERSTVEGQSSFKVFGKGNKVAPNNSGKLDFGGATVVEDDGDAGGGVAGGFGNATVVEQDDDEPAPAAGFSNQTVVEQD